MTKSTDNDKPRETSITSCRDTGRGVSVKGVDLVTTHELKSENNACIEKAVLGGFCNNTAVARESGGSKSDSSAIADSDFGVLAAKGTSCVAEGR